jgi:nitrate reductase alpha subunit
MTAASRAAAMVLIITGNMGKFGTGQHTWAGNYKAGIWAATPWSGGGLAVHTGYQSNFRYGAQQSFTRNWLMPMHQTDSLPGKHAIAWKFKWGYQVDNHAINTTPKECLIRITKAEDGGIGARGPWEPVRTGFTPGQENEFMIKWLKGEHIKIKV